MGHSGLLLGTCTLLRKQHGLDVRQNAPLRNGDAREELVELFIIPEQVSASALMITHLYLIAS